MNTARSAPDSSAPEALVLRHAERPALPDDATGHEVSITTRGRAEALALGERLDGRLVAVYTSPIARCVETAHAVAGGRSVVLDPRLGGPGPYVRDLDLAWSRWRSLGHDRVLEDLCSGRDEVPGLHPLHTTSHALVRSLLATACAHGGLTVFVTHDVVLAPLVTTLLARPLAKAEWPGFLEPLGLLPGPPVLATYRGTPHAVDATLDGPSPATTAGVDAPHRV